MQSKQVFEILVRQHASMLMAFLRSSIRDESLVDDLFQETMLVAWRRLDEFDRDRAFGPWLRGIAGKLILAQRRNDAKQGIHVDEASLIWLESQFRPVDNHPGDTFSDKLTTLRDCVDGLPAAYQEPIRLRYQQGLNLDEIVQSLSIALTTLKKRLSRGKQKIADCFELKRLAIEMKE